MIWLQGEIEYYDDLLKYKKDPLDHIRLVERKQQVIKMIDWIEYQNK
jgi:hypothetical protein